MSIPTQLSLHGYIATAPELTKTRDGSPRFHARIGVERFRVGDSFVAAGYVNEYEVDREGQKIPRQEFVARKIGHDLARTRYEVLRRSAAVAEPATAAATEAIDHVIGL